MDGRVRREPSAPPPSSQAEGIRGPARFLQVPSPNGLHFTSWANVTGGRGLEEEDDLMTLPAQELLMQRRTPTRGRRVIFDACVEINGSFQSLWTDLQQKPM